MRVLRRIPAVTIVALHAVTAAAQSAGPPKPPPPLWDFEIGGSFVGTSGNADTTTLGSDISMHRRWPDWKIEATASGVRSTDAGRRTAERYIGAFRADHRLTSRIDISAGERAESDRLAGISFRSISDGGVKYGIVRRTYWTLDGISSLAINHERSTLGPVRNRPIAVLQGLNKFILSPTSDTTQRITVYPDLKQSDSFRAEAELTAQAALNSRLALKIGYLWRFSNAPTFGFVTTDTTATASFVLRWKASTLAPNP